LGENIKGNEMASMQEKKHMFILVGNHRGKKPKHRWEDNIKMDPNEIGCSCVVWFQLTRDRINRLITMVMNLWVM
jgi:hypothetical protein